MENKKVNDMREQSNKLRAYAQELISDFECYYDESEKLKEEYNAAESMINAIKSICMGENR